MDRRAFVASAAVLLQACGGQAFTQQEIARGVLSYDVGWIGCSRLASVELTTRFALVVRDLASEGDAAIRIDLGPSDYDVSRLIVRDEEPTAAWVASTDGTVRRFDIANRSAEWTLRLGSPATALAVGPKYLVSGTRSGVMCLRRRSDLALLQCVVAHSGEVSDLELHGDRVWSSGHDGHIQSWRLPTLRRSAGTSLPGSANALSVSTEGQVAIALSSSPPVRSQAVVARERRGESDPGRIAIWKPNRAPRFLRGHTGPVTDVQWSGQNQLLSTSWDRSFRSWNPANGESTTLAKFGHLGKRLSMCGDELVAVAAWTTQQDGPATVVLRGQKRSFPSTD